MGQICIVNIYGPVPCSLCVSENIGPNSPKIIWLEIEALEGQQVRVFFSVLAVRLN